MTCRERLAAYFEQHRVPYDVASHPIAYTAQEIAAVEHIPGKLVAKVVVAATARGPVMLVLPATHCVNLAALKELLADPETRLAREDEFSALFPDCETGAMPPFGNLYDVPVVVDRSLRDDKEVVFQAGTHRETMRIAFADYERLVQPRIGDFAHHA